MRKPAGSPVPGAALLTLLAATFVLTRWPFWQHLQINPDAMSYWAAGRELAHGHGLVWPIKPYFYPDDGRTAQPAIGRLSITFTILLCGLEASGAGFRSATIFLGLLALLDAWFVYAIARNLCGRLLAAVAAVLFVANPTLVQASTTLWTEPLALAFVLGAYLLAARWLAAKDRARWPVVVCGMLLGVGYVTRPGDLVYFAAIAIGTALVGQWRRIGLIVIGFAVSAVPYWTANTMVNGSPSYTMYSLLTRTVFYGSAMYTGFNRTYPPTGELLRRHAPEIAAQVLRNVALCWQVLSRAANLGIVATAAAVVILFAGCVSIRKRRPIWPRNGVSPGQIGFAVSLLLGGAFNLLSAFAVWSTHEEERFLLGTWALFLVICFALLNVLRCIFPENPACSNSGSRQGHRQGRLRYWRRVLASHPVPRSAPAALIGIAIGVAALQASAATICRDAATLSSRHGKSWREALCERYEPACRIIRQRSSPSDVVAGSDPWMVNYLSNRPTVLLPALQPGEIDSFLTRYRVKWIAADPARMPSPADQDDFGAEALSSWRSRDWRLVRLRKSVRLQEIPLPERATSLRLYRVIDQQPSAGSKVPAG